MAKDLYARLEHANIRHKQKKVAQCTDESSEQEFCQAKKSKNLSKTVEKFRNLRQNNDIEVPVVKSKLKGAVRNRADLQPMRNPKLAQAKSQVKQDIQQVKQFVPLELIYSHGQGLFASAAEQKAVLAVHEAMLRLCNQNIRYGFQVWQDFVVQTRLDQRNVCATRIQRFCKEQHAMLLARQELAILRQVKLEEERREEEELRKMIGASNIVTRCWRLYRLRIRILIRKQKNDAAIRIQNFFRIVSEKWACTVILIANLRKHFSAIKIQTRYRMVLAKRRLRLLRKIKAVDDKIGYKMANEKQKEYRLKLSGAAFVIQTQWRMKLETRRLRYVRERMYRDARQHAAHVMQRSFRCYLANVTVRNFRSRRMKAIVTLQCCFRKYFAKNAYTALHTKKFTAIEARIAAKKLILGENYLQLEDEELFIPTDSVLSTFGIKKDCNTCAILIQGRWRGVRTRKRVRILNHRSKEKKRRKQYRLRKTSATIIQKRMRGILGRFYTWRLKQHYCALRLQSIWRGHRIRKLLRLREKEIAAAKLIKLQWAKCKLRHLIWLRTISATKFQALYRAYVGRKFACQYRIQSHRYQEDKIFGLQQLECTIRIAESALLRACITADLEDSDFVYLPHLMTDDTSKCRGLFHDLFVTACNWGSKGGASENIDSVRFSKFFKDSPGLLNRKLTPQALDIAFSKFKSPNVKGLTYSQFINAINLVVQLRRLHWEIEASPGKPTKELEPKTFDNSLLEHKAFSQAFVLLITEYIFNATWGKVFRERLRDQAVMELGKMASKTQTLARRFLGRKLKHRLIALNSALQEHNYLASMASKIQWNWRMLKSKMCFEQFLASVIIEYVDYESGAPFYVNPHTGSKKWTKPVLLGKLNCNLSIKLPPVGEEFVVHCQQHIKDAYDKKTTVLATKFCLTCEVALCNSCFKTAHSRPTTASHPQVPIELCMLCRLQTATKVCTVCGDGTRKYCETCFPYLHDSKQLGEHKYRLLVSLCSECECRAAQWKCHVCDDLYCRVCLARLHRKGRRQGHATTYLHYYAVERIGNEVKVKEKLAANKARDAYVIKAKQEREALDQQNFEKAVLCIQSRFRGRRERARARDYVKLVRKTQMALHQRKKDDVIRKSANYKIKLALGKASELPSDTLKERQLLAYRKRFKNRVGLLAGYKSENLKFLLDTGEVRDAKTVFEAASFSVREIPVWCVPDAKVVFVNGQYKNQTAYVVCTKNLLRNGHVKVYIDSAVLSLSIPLYDLRPRLSDEEERIRASALLSIKSRVSHGVSGAKEILGTQGSKLIRKGRKALHAKWIEAQIAYMVKSEFKDIVPYAWKRIEVPVSPSGEMEVECDDEGMCWWNVVNNSKTKFLPRGVTEMQDFDPTMKKEIEFQIVKAERKLTNILSGTSLVAKGARNRRFAIDCSLESRRLINTAHSFFRTIQSKENGKGITIAGLNGIYIEKLSDVISSFEDTPGYSLILSYFLECSVGEKEETLDELLEMDLESIQAQSHIHRLANMSAEQEIERREYVDKKRGY